MAITRQDAPSPMGMGMAGALVYLPASAQPAIDVQLTDTTEFAIFQIYRIARRNPS